MSVMRTYVGFLVAVAAAACTKDEPPTGSLGTVTIPAKAPAPPAMVQAPAKAAAPAPAGFEERFATLTKKTSAISVDSGGSALQGNVRQASAPPEGTAAAVAADPNAAVAEEISGDAVERVIRENLPAVKSCYRLVSKGASASGKAIVSFGVGADGKPSEVKVDAPAFADTILPRCVEGLVARWTFPRSHKGGAGFSYPMVFVGS